MFKYEASSSHPESQIPETSAWLVVDDQSRSITFDFSFLNGYFSDEHFNLTGILAEYPHRTGETEFTIKVYSFECAEHDGIDYTVGD